MLILDNSVLSAFTRLKLMTHLRELFPTLVISDLILEEYSERWQNDMPNWIKIIKMEENFSFHDVPLSLSTNDLSVIQLGLNCNSPIASDDIPLRKYAKKHGLQVIGSLGLLKTLHKQKIIPRREKYIELVELLSQDVYISEELKKWAFKDED